MTTIDPRTSPLDAIRDWLAEQNGWERFVSTNGIVIWHRGGAEGETYRQHKSHPYPPTIDGAASAMPEGWEWRRLSTFWNVGYGLWWEAFIWNEGVTIVRLRDTGDEIADRYRLAAACVLAEEQTNGS